MKKSTQELFDLMKKTQAFDTYMEITKEERVETTVSAALKKLLEEKTSIKANVLRPPAWTGPRPTRFFLESKTPSRDKLLALCLGMGLTLEENPDAAEADRISSSLSTDGKRLRHYTCPVPKSYHRKSE